MRNVPPFSETPTLGQLLRQPYERLQKEVYASLAAHGFPDIRPAHSSLFRYVAPEGSRVSDLADAAQMTKQSMAYLTADLENLGYVTVGPDPQDGRAKRVVLTERGLSVRSHLIGISLEFENRCAALIGEARIRDLRAILADLTQALGGATESGRS
ncbi:MAG: MarR family winged helix-turn-helix transcriptional regulator [Asticcacaulis sp.]